MQYISMEPTVCQACGYNKNVDGIHGVTNSFNVLAYSILYMFYTIHTSLYLYGSPVSVFKLIFIHLSHHISTIT